MGIAFKVGILKTIFLLTYFLFVLTAYFAWAQSPKDCGELSFKTNILKFEKIESCYDVVLEVSNNENCRYELSHFNFDFGCGTISKASNSQGWAMELNQIDPTTDIGGIKIDDIENFGKDPELTSFQVEFTFCPDQECDENALVPSVAYKAGQCVYYEKPVLEQEEQDDEESDGDGNDDEQSELIVSINKTDPSCNNISGGSIELIVNEGTAPYEISWNTGQTEFILQNLTAGSYSYVITDASGKQVEGEVILENPALFNINATLTHPDCQGANSGSIDIGIEGGIAPYTFLWSNGSSNQNLTNLYAGTYNVQVTDASGCSAEKTITLINSTSIQVEAKVTQPSCQEGTAGSIALSVTGGTEPYTFSWSNDMESATIDGLSDGYYRVTITDQNGCSYSKTYSIITDTGITAFASVTKTNCFDAPIGEIDLT
ncbi:MAG: SprB repeat-containing protein, partial [Cyclobacteriaceae bacterium]|nr:SprB repeat-containing protein [Cyclobacteriaceae bacterium]